MRLLLKFPNFKFVWMPKASCRLFSKHGRRCAPINVSDPELPDVYKMPEYFNFAHDVLDKWTQLEKDGRRSSSNPALWWVGGKGDEVKWSFEELGLLSRKAATVLSAACGLKRGDRLMVILPRIPEWWLITVGCIRTGIVFIPATTQLRANDILYRLQSSEAKCIITNDMLAPAVDSVVSKCQFLKTKVIVSEGNRDGWLNFNDLFRAAPGDHTPVKTKHHEPMVIYFTSGTTGYPKMVEHSCSSFGIGLTGVGSYRFMSLEHCVSGGEPNNPEVMKQWKSKTGLDIYEGYGQTETVLVCCSSREMKIKPGAIGKPVAPYDVQIIDENCNTLPPGEEGDIALRIKPTRPFCLFSRYVGDPEKTAATERGDFYITGDRGFKDEDGYIWFVGRADDIILSSGYRIGPFEVEHALMEHPAVAESAVVSSPDPIRGEVVKAFIVLSPNYTSHDPEKLTLELQEHVKKVTAPYKYPRKVEFVEHLPKTISGKVQRKQLRNKEWGKI
ncbi:PREDICTED: acyl-coenzyme A synthetase ACSM4, mitochondrial-like isoform X3 [Crocodylus porosus]|uniref:acyl-coenzyme A synthetase ACSM4, mitochondrial-like isoform X3 n=1 Tax=Crocodylus porosus TaxID=8502 RepID=UPI00093CE6E7|nr:PREDICTED: acyl-coenzyme A synthetase ACSM4, mitochondrial-like isoform X3 [Crocodylus porosus]